MTRRDWLIVGACLVGAVWCAAGIAQGAERPDRWYRVSQVALVGANVADLATSRGHYELNPLVAGRDGRFSLGRGVALKVGYLGGLTLVQGRMPRHRRMWTIANFVVAGAFTGIAIRNGRIHP